MAERFGLVGEARPHLSHLQHRGSGLGVARGASDLQASRRKPAILLGAPHLALFQFPLRTCNAAERLIVPLSMKRPFSAYRKDLEGTASG
jgi:hypothetical protein